MSTRGLFSCKIKESREYENNLQLANFIIVNITSMPHFYGSQNLHLANETCCAVARTTECFNRVFGSFIRVYCFNSDGWALYSASPPFTKPLIYVIQTFQKPMGSIDKLIKSSLLYAIYYAKYT